MSERAKNRHWNSAAAVLRTVFPDSAAPEKLRVYRVWEIWPKVVGPANARGAQPTKFRNGKLFVTVFHPALMQELQFVKARIRKRLNHYIGADLISQIYFVRGPVRPDDMPPQSVPQRTLPEFRDVVIPPIENPQVKAAFASLLAAHRRRVAKIQSDEAGLHKKSETRPLHARCGSNSKTDN